MKISRFTPDELSAAFGIDMAAVPGIGPGAGWGRVAPGGRSEAHQHDETEIFVIVRGTGELLVDGERTPARPGTVAMFEPFETHVIENTGTEELLFFDLYWRDSARAAAAAAAAPADRRRFGKRPVFVFSTPPTPNGDLHLGHLSGPYLGADVFTRFQRMNGVEAWHLTGSDDHQSYVADRAQRDGRTPAQTAAHFSAEIAATLALMDIRPDQYTVTQADTDYPDGLRSFFSRLVASGAVNKRATPALFDASTGDYLHEVVVSGGCPGCGEPTGGNICEECGEPNLCTDLTDPRSQRSGEPPRRAAADRYCLPLHEFQATVAAHHRLGRVPARLRELAHRVFTRPLLELPLTHPAHWGVSPRESDAKGQVIWVWPEMAYGFLHGIEALGRTLNRGWRAKAPQQAWKIVHFFGYDNSFYHSLLYPVLYKLAFPGWEPDIDYHVNEFYLLEHQKFSTSRRHAIWGKDILSTDSVDAVRFFLARTRPEGRRTNFDPTAYETLLSDTLIGTWQRWLNGLGSRIDEHHDRRAPDTGVWTPEHTAFLDRLAVRLTAITRSLGQDGFSLNRAATELDGIVEDTVAFADRERALAGLGPWQDETRTALALELAAARLLARCAAPIMPRFGRRLSAALGLPDTADWPGGVELLPAGTKVTLTDTVFFLGGDDKESADV
ncbi:class I tRNA ligase family protein [Streptomyces sp. NBC_01176]|uniref:class I tRNA ligase family protein n=1 Tax=Streptomyces sp. NBC_01176 TaxID=2903760 RepID=UPI00386EE410|nr:class I tRNA ligase family protein [Streptomyces sp. NBC_01176]WSS89387.1 class I tRNA ligase family protein [Streptomyces sp. NBC_01176]